MTFRQNILQCLGEFPQKVELDYEILSSQPKQGYTQHRIAYNVEAGERVHAALLVPSDIAGQAPAILANHQHAGQWHMGKSEVTGEVWDTDPGMYAYGRDLALRGYVVLCPDQLCFEERLLPQFAPRDHHTSGERFAFCNYIQHGSCLQTKYLHDSIAAVDLLCSLSYVDSDRIGAIGHSMGGQNTLWLTWLDQRIKAGISSCGFGMLSTIIRDGVLHNSACYVPGMARYGDMDELLLDIAPRAFALTSGIQDAIFPIDGVRHIAERAAKRYADLGIPDRFLADIFEGGHCFAPAQKDSVYAWLDRQLKL